MHLPKFEHIRPETLQAASQLLQDYGQQARLVAGGTDLFPRMKYGLLRPDVVVSLRGIPTETPAVTEDGGLQLDALMTLAELARSPLVQNRAPAVASAALGVGSNQIRQMGTLGGNLCLQTRCLYYNQSHTYQFVEPCFKRGGDRCYLIPKGRKCRAVFAADVASALISSGASVEIMGAGKKRRTSLESFYTGDPVKPFKLSHEEIIATVHIPPQPEVGGAAFMKFTQRGGLEFAALSVAVSLEMEPDGATCEAARIILGAIAPRPLPARRAEAAMAGQSLSPALFQEAARIVSEEVRPYAHHSYSSGYLKYAMKTYAFRALTKAAGFTEDLS